MKHLIVTGSHRAFLNRCKELGIHQSQARKVDTVEKLKGLTLKKDEIHFEDDASQLVDYDLIMSEIAGQLKRNESAK